MEYDSRVIVFAVRGARGFADGEASHLTPLIDRPFLQHTLECLADRGFAQIDLVVSEDAANIEHEFGDGQRWGISIQYHQERDPERPYTRLRIYTTESQPFLLIDADQLQPEKWMHCRPEEHSDPIRYIWQDNSTDQSNWTGAAWLHPEHLAHLPLTEKRDKFGEALSELAGCRDEVVNEPLDGRTFEGLISAQRRLFEGEFPELMKCGPPNEDGVWIGRNTVIPADICLVGPAFIGANVELANQNTIGPNVTILDDSYVSKSCEISDTMVLPSSLVGEGLAICRCVLDRHRLYSIDHNISFMVNDDVLIGSTHRPLRNRAFIRRTIARIVAAALFVMFLPLILIVALSQRIRHGAAFDFVEVVRLPALENPPTWKTYRRWQIKCSPAANTNLHHFLCEFLPGLMNVLRGECGWVGVTPMSPAVLEGMPKEWLETYLACDAGLVNETVVTYGPQATRDEIVSSEVCCAAICRSFSGRVRQMASYVLSLVIGPRVLRGNFLRHAKRKAMVH